MSLLDTFLRPLQIFLHLLGRLHAVGEIRAVVLEPALSECLQFHKLTILGIEFAGSETC